VPLEVFGAAIGSMSIRPHRPDRTVCTRPLAAAHSGRPVLS